jgi:hypothetical protein
MSDEHAKGNDATTIIEGGGYLYIGTKIQEGIP